MVGAYFMVDMAHFAGIVAAGLHPTPFGHAHVVTTTTHKTLRGPRGGMILTDDDAIAKKINSAVFPGLQGGPLMHVIAAKAVAFGEALQPDYKTYIAAVVENAKTLAATLKERGADLVSGGTDTHLALVDLTPLGVTGRDADEALERAGITCNKNGIPNDPLPPVKTSGIRVGSPCGHDARVRHGGIPRDRPYGRRRPRRPCQKGRAGGPGGRGGRSDAGAGSVRALPHLSRITTHVDQGRSRRDQARPQARQEHGEMGRVGRGRSRSRCRSSARSSVPPRVPAMPITRPRSRADAMPLLRP